MEASFGSRGAHTLFGEHTRTVGHERILRDCKQRRSLNFTHQKPPSMARDGSMLGGSLLADPGTERAAELQLFKLFLYHSGIVLPSSCFQAILNRNIANDRSQFLT